MTRLRTILLLCLVAQASRLQGATWYSTQSGAGSGIGTTIGNAWSVSQFNASNTAAGDTVLFSGTFTSTVIPHNSGSTNNPIILDFSAATLNTASPRIQISSKSFLNVLGGQFGVGDVSMVSFNNSRTSHDILIANWGCTNTDGSQSGLCFGEFCWNLTISNCFCYGLESLYWGDTTNDHHVTIINNRLNGSTNIVDQTDLISAGDVHDMLIQGNWLTQNSPGANSGRHNDCIQMFEGGSSEHGTPYGWVVRYNRIELNVKSGSGDNSWMMFENLDNGASSDAADVYDNIFLGLATGGYGNNGVNFNSNNSGAIVRFYNNTVIVHTAPGNSVYFYSPGNLYAENNVMEADNTSSVLLDWTMTISKSDFNIYYGYGSPSSTYTGANGHANTNPLFVDYANNNLALASNSPCIGNGDTNVTAIYTQGIAPGATWPNPALLTRTNADVGAYVYAGTTNSPATNSPVTVTNGLPPAALFIIQWPKTPSGKGTTAISLVSDYKTNSVALTNVPYPATACALAFSVCQPGSNYLTGKYSTSGSAFAVTNITAPGLIYTGYDTATNINGPWSHNLLGMTPIVAGMVPRKYTRLWTRQTQWPDWAAILMSPTNDVTNAVAQSRPPMP